MDVGGRSSRFRLGDYVSGDPGPRLGSTDIPPGHPGVVQSSVDPPAVGVWWALPGGGFRSFHEIYDQDQLKPLSEDDFLSLVASVHEQPVAARFDGGGGGYVDRKDLPSE